MNIEIIILAAGKGTRMHSSLPKVLHKLADKPLVKHVIDTASKLEPVRIVGVYGHGGNKVPAAFANDSIEWVEQSEQLGTGHAVQQGIKAVSDDSIVIVLYGDVPLTSLTTLQALLNVANEKNCMGLLTAKLKKPKGYGRILRNVNGDVLRIVEEKDASEEVKLISEINTGIMCAKASDFRGWLAKITNRNAQKEYYLTDVIELAVAGGYTVNTVIAENNWEIEGVNNKLQLATLERRYQLNIAESLMEAGIGLMDPFRIDVRGSLTAGQDCCIDINTLFEGDVKLGSGVTIGANSIISNSIIGDNTSVKPNSIIENSTIGQSCTIGPFARIRPDTNLANGVRIGNFVEIKQSDIAEGSKINHLSYIGNTEMGSNVNIGAGTITCNYDGANKHKSTIGNDVFIGSGTQLIAPVTVNNGATIGAGSTITTEAPADLLSLSRSKQFSVKNWQRPIKNKK